MIVLAEEDLAQLPEPVRHRIQVLHFCPPGQVDPVRYAKPYFLAPDGDAAAHAYALLREAMHDTGQAAVVRLVLRQRQRLALVNVSGDVLRLETLLWADELRTPDFPLTGQRLTGEELTIARQLVQQLTADFDPDAHTDTYQQALRDLVTAKAAPASDGQASPATAGQPRDATADLITALRASLTADSDSDSDSRSDASPQASSARPPDPEHRSSSPRSSNKPIEQHGGRSRGRRATP
jgi:DNA end-binding protein Ku